MIRAAFLGIWLCLPVAATGGDGDIIFRGRYSNTPFREFVQDVEGKTDARFFYLEDWVRELAISASGEQLSLEDVLRQHLAPRGLIFRIHPDHNVFLSPEPILTTLLQPSDTMATAEEPGTDGQFIDPDEKYFGVRRAEIIETIVIGQRDRATPGENASLYGKIWDESSGEAMIGATIYFEEIRTGAVTDVTGRYRTAVAPGNYTVQISCLGMRQITYHLEIHSDGNLDVAMEKEIIPINEVVIQADRYQNVRGMQMGFAKLNTKKIKEIPVVMGERDLLKVAQMLPGVQSVGEGSMGINVRGSSADQNMFYVNKVPVYNTSHLFGFFSAFNPDIIKDFDLYKSNIPVEYGGRLASFFNISTREGNKNRLTGRGGITPVTGHIALEGPIKQQKHSFVLSARTTYSDWLLKRMEDPDIRNSSASFYDLAGSVNLEPDDRNLIKAFVYSTSDRFRYTDLVSYEYMNRGASIDWRRRLTPSMSSELAAAFGQYAFSTTNTEVTSTAYKHDYSIGQFQFTSNFSWVPHQKHTIIFGATLNQYRLRRGTIEPYGSESIRRRLELGNENALEGAVYAGDTYKLLPWLSVYGGIRYGIYGLMGPGEVYTYYGNGPKTDSYISDTMNYSQGSLVKQYSGPEIRTALNINTGENSSVKISYNRIKQYMFLLSNTIAISPTDQWKLCDYHIKPPYGDQISAGFYKDFPETGLRTSIESYFKKIDNIVEYKDGAEFITSPHIEQDVLQGNQTAYGVELMVEKSAGKLNGWISYTYSSSRILVNGGQPWNKINNGLRYPSNYDKPHALNLILNYRMNRRLSVSANMVYSSGRPVTYPVSIYYLNGQEIIQYSERNAYRIPDYFRTDISFNLEGNLRSRKVIHSYWMLNFYNLTGRNNAYSVYFRSEEGRINGYKMSIFGNPMVTLSWNFKFGNYASE